jgi:hypothetical protein
MAFSQEFQGGLLVSGSGDIGFEDLALMVDGAPQIAGLAGNRHEHLVHVPAPLRDLTQIAGSAFSDHACEQASKAIDPKPDALMADIDTALMEQILDVAQREREADVHHHRELDDFG